MLEETIRTGAAEMGIPLDEVSLAAFRRFYDFLDERNKVMDLTAVKGEEDAARSHFLDSLSLLPHLKQGASLCDVGSGAGFPGVPAAIARADLHVTLMESMIKRCEFLRAAAALDGMPPIEVVCARAEEAGITPAHRGRYDVVTARAVAKLNILAELCLPLVKPGGLFIAMKGPGAAEETAEAKRAIAALGGGEVRTVDYAIPGSDRTRCLIIVKKIAPTPKQHPRRYAKIVKTPLI